MPGDLDLVLVGATGYTGRLVAEYLAQREAHTKSGLRWGIAGRSLDRLESLRQDLLLIDPRLAELPIRIVDLHDESSTRRLASGTQVVCSTAGPYALHGMPLVDACVEAGVDYCDLAGEVPWIRRVIDRHHATAERSGVRIVPCSGFDAIPSDLGCWSLQQALQDRLGRYASEISLHVLKLAGGLSGGTLASMLELSMERRDPLVARWLRDPYALLGEPREGAHRPDLPRQPRLFDVEWDERSAAWLGPFVMASVNTRVVHRTHALLAWPWGSGFRYRERTRFAGGALGRIQANVTGAGLRAFAGLVDQPWGRAGLSRFVLPRPGTGPSRAARERGSYLLELRPSLESGDDAGITLRISGHRDPGYGDTAVMLGEAAILLTGDAGQSGLRGGVITPAVAFGARLVDRLRGAGLGWDLSPAEG